MRRAFTPLILFAALLTCGGLAITSDYNWARLANGYVPTLNPDPIIGQQQALILVSGIAAALFLTVGLGVGLALGAVYLTRSLARVAAQAPAAGRAAPAPDAGGAAPRPPPAATQLPLTSTRSLVIFWVSLIVIVVGFQAIRLWGEPLGYLPNLFTMPVATRAATTAPPAPTGPTDLQATFAALPTGHAENGQAVFTSAGCAACHSLEPDVRLVGPSLAGGAARAATRRPGYAPELYLYESITNPNAFVVEGFQPDIMPKTFADTLNPQELADVIAFLLTHE